MTGRLCKQGDL